MRKHFFSQFESAQMRADRQAVEALNIADWRRRKEADEAAEESLNVEEFIRVQMPIIDEMNDLNAYIAENVALIESLPTAPTTVELNAAANLIAEAELAAAAARAKIDEDVRKAELAKIVEAEKAAKDAEIAAAFAERTKTLAEKIAEEAKKDAAERAAVVEHFRKFSVTHNNYNVPMEAYGIVSPKSQEMAVISCGRVGGKKQSVVGLTLKADGDVIKLADNKSLYDQMTKFVEFVDKASLTFDGKQLGVNAYCTRDQIFGEKFIHAISRTINGKEVKIQLPQSLPFTTGMAIEATPEQVEMTTEYAYDETKYVNLKYRDQVFKKIPCSVKFETVRSWGFRPKAGVVEAVWSESKKQWIELAKSQIFEKDSTGFVTIDITNDLKAAVAAGLYEPPKVVAPKAAVKRQKHFTKPDAPRKSAPRSYKCDRSEARTLKEFGGMLDSALSVLDELQLADA